MLSYVPIVMYMYSVMLFIVMLQELLNCYHVDIIRVIRVCHFITLHLPGSEIAIYTSIKIIKNEVGCRDDTVPKTVDTRRHCEEE